MNEHDLPRSRELGPRQQVNLNNARRNARTLLAYVAACDGGAVASAERLLATPSATLARACGLQTKELQALLGEATALYSKRERERTPHASTDALGRRIALLVALSVAKEIAHNAGVRP